MKIKIIQMHSYKHEQEKNTAILLSYKRFLSVTKEERTLLSGLLWQELKNKNKKLIFTIDHLSWFINDGQILGEEIVTFLKFLQSNAIALSGILDLLQDNEENSWDQIELAEQPVEAVDENLKLIQALESERKKTKLILKDWLYEKSKFFVLTYKYCPLLLSGLETKNLHALVLKNPASISLLLNDKFSQRLSGQLTREDIITLFSADVKDGQRNVYLLILLEYLAKKQPGLLIIFFKLLNSMPSDIMIKNSSEIRKRLLECGSKFLEFLEHYPDFFIHFAEKMEIFFELLNVAENPISFLSTLARKNLHIGNWVGDRILIITAKFLENESFLQKQEIKKFLNNYSTPLNSKKMTYSSLLRFEVKDMVREIDKYGIVELNALFNVLENKEIRDSFKFDSSDYLPMLRSPIFRRLVERIIVSDEALWYFLNDSLQELLFEHNLNLKNNYLFLYSYLGLYNRIQEQNVTYYFSENIDATSAFLIANGDKWQSAKKCIDKALPDKANNLHPIFQVKLQFDQKKAKVEFKHFLISYLFDEGFYLLLGGRDHLDLFFDLASGKNYVNFLKKIIEIKDSEHIEKNKNFKGEITRLIDTVLKKIVSNFYFSIKFSAALNKTNLISLSDYLGEKQLTSWLDAQELVSAILHTEEQVAFGILKKIASNQQLIVKLMNQSQESEFYCSQLLTLLSIRDVPEILFACLEVNDYLTVLNNTSVDIIKFLMEHHASASLTNTLYKIIGASLESLENDSLIEYLFSVGNHAKNIAAFIKPEQLIRIFLLPSICTSKKITTAILSYDYLLPFEALSQERSSLITLLSKNRFFAEIVFTRWSLFKRLQLSPETLLSVIAEEKFEETFEYLAEKNCIYLVAYLQTITSILPERLQRLVNRQIKVSPIKFQETDSTAQSDKQICKKSEYSILDAGEIELKLKNFSLLEESDGAVCQYKDLTGHKALALKIIHLQLILNFKMGLTFLFEKLPLSEELLSINYVPISFLLNDEYYHFVSTKLLPEAASTILAYLNSFPSDHRDLKYFFNLDDDVQQIAFVQILHRIKQLTISLLTRYIYFSVDHKDLPQEFLRLLSIMTINYPAALYSILKNKTVFLRFFNFIYSRGEEMHRHQEKGAVLFRFALLEALLHQQWEDKNNYINPIIYELNLFELDFSEVEKTALFNLFPRKLILNSRNSCLIGYFLKQPLYTSMLSCATILEVVKLYPELMQLVFIYPHLYKKLSSEDIQDLAKFHTPTLGHTPKEISNRLSMSFLTVCIVQEHDFFNDTPTMIHSQTGSTTKLLTVLEATQCPPLKEMTSFDGDVLDTLSNYLCVNNYLSFDDEMSVSLIESILKIQPWQIKFEIIKNLTLMVTEHLDKEIFAEIFEQTSLLINKNLKKVNFSLQVVEEWQKNYGKGVARHIEELMQEELATITGIKISSSESIDSNLDTLLLNQLQ